MKNKILLFALVALLALIVVACAPAPTPAPTAAPPTKAPAPTAVPATKPPEATKPPAPTTAPAAKYKEAPALAELVKSGKLPPVEKRLPDEPLVVPVVEKVGTYGGTIRRGFTGPSDANNYVRIAIDSLVWWSIDGSKIEPKLLKSWNASPDFKVWTLNMRKGAKWSDGNPFTADDILFWYKDTLLNKDLTPAVPQWMQNADKSTALVEKVDDYTVRFTFQASNNLFLHELVNKDGGDRTLAVFLPAHYLKQFHASYAKKDDLDKMVADAKFKTWVELFMTRATPAENPDRPTMAAWVPTSRVSDQIFALKRNPYYIGVDPEGNQLPYVDEFRFVFYADAKTLNVAAVAGDLDLQDRHIDMPNYPVLKENEQKGGKYRVLMWPGFGGGDASMTFNQTYDADPVIGELLRTKDFRIALSHAINREQIRQSAFLGLGEIRQNVPPPANPFYPGDDAAFKYTKFDQATANKLLDGIGLDKKGADGIRLMKNGKPVTIDISVVPAFGPWPDIGQLIAKDWEKVGVKGLVQIRERALDFSMRENNTLQCEIWNTNSSPFTANSQVDPRAQSIVPFGTLWRVWYRTNGKEGVEPPAEVKKIVANIDKAKTVSAEEQAKLGKEIYQIWTDNIWQIGTVGLTAMIQGVVVVNKDLKNVPAKAGNDWPLRTPGNARIEQFYYAK
ncbi:MAG: ABC transporter substrate-binding protein [Chloroflexi bacterium]|nr:ABC transporter substrate-binding protein [Chloroflexota bacterium]